MSNVNEIKSTTYLLSLRYKFYNIKFLAKYVSKARGTGNSEKWPNYLDDHLRGHGDQSRNN